MNCPRCKTPISSADLYCSRCGRLLNIECPRCGTSNQGSVCTKCKLKLTYKCEKCQHKNLILFQKCIKCGTENNTNTGIKSSKLTRFAILGIEFVNLSQLKNTIGDSADKFKEGLYKFIKFQSTKINAEFKLLKEDLIIISFNHSDTIFDSCNSAIEMAISTISFIKKINYKISNISNLEIKVKMGVSMSSVLDRRGLAREERSVSSKDTYSVVVNPVIYKHTSSKYKYNHLASIFVGGELASFYQLDLNSIEFEEEDPISKVDIQKASWSDEDLTNEINRSKLFGENKRIDFVSQEETQKKIEELVSEDVDFKFINIINDFSHDKIFDFKYSKLKQKTVQNRWIKIYLNEKNKIYPYSFLRNLIRNFFRLNIFSINSENEEESIENELRNLLNVEYEELKELLLLKVFKEKDVYEIKYKLFTQIKRFFEIVGSDIHRNIFVVQNMENIDRSSLECLKFLFENNFLKGNICFVASCDKIFSLSKAIPVLNQNHRYYEIYLEKESRDNIAKFVSRKIKAVEQSYVFAKLVENSNGSTFYVDEGIKYLIEQDVLAYRNDFLRIVSDNVVTIPAGIYEILKKRIEFLAKSKDIYKIYTAMILLGPMIDLSEFKKFFKEDVISHTETLKEKGLIEYLNNKQIILTSYNLNKKALLETIKDDKLLDIINHLRLSLKIKEDFLHPLNIEFNEYIDNEKDNIKLFYGYAQVCVSLGDIPTGANVFEKFIKNLLETTKDKEKSHIENVYNMISEVYEQVGELSFEQYPDIGIKYLEKAIKHAEKTEDIEKVISLITLIVQSCSYEGYHDEILAYIGKITTLIPKETLDINNESFNPKFFMLNYIKIQALFNIGRLQETVETANKTIPILDLIKSKQLLGNNRSAKFIDNIISDIIQYKLKSMLLLLDKDFEDSLSLITKYCQEKPLLKDMLILGLEALRGVKPETLQKIEQLAKNKQIDSEISLVNSVLSVISKIQLGKWKDVIVQSHSVKPVAENLKDYQIICLLNLFTGIAHKNINNLKNARNIFEEVLEFATEKSLMNIMFISWYLLSDVELLTGNIDKAFEITGKAVMIIEKDDKLSKIFSIYFKYQLARILKAKQDYTNAEKCIKQSLNTASQYGFIYNQATGMMLLAEILNDLAKQTEDQSQAELYHQEISSVLEKWQIIVKDLSNPLFLERLKTPAKK